MILTPQKKSKLTSNELNRVIETLQRGDVIAMPTETVYGLAADAENLEAIKKIFALKGRPIDHPLILHIGDKKDLEKYAVNIPSFALILADCIWPGPLTIVLKKSARVSDLITANQDTVAIRMPSHPIALQILKNFAHGLVAPSANKFGHISPTTAQHVYDEFGENIPIIIDGGSTKVGIESTILNLTSEVPTILRPGIISKKMLENILGIKILSNNEAPIKNQPKVSGSLKSHYAPKTKTIVIDGAKLKTGVNELQKSKKIAVLSQQKKPAQFNGVWLIMSKNPNTAAQKLYKQLRELDRLKLDLIIIENVDDSDQWSGIKDRITRASVSF